MIWGTSAAKKVVALVAVTISLAAVGCRSSEDPVALATTTSVATKALPESVETTAELTTTTSGEAINVDDAANPVLVPWDQLWQTLASEEITAEQETEAPISDPAILENLRLLAPDGGVAVRHPLVTTNGEASAEILDCVILPGPVQEGSKGSVQVKVALSQSDGDWVINELVGWDLNGCVPREIASEALLAYERYWDVYSAIWDPPNPADPNIEQTMIGPALQETLTELQSFADRGEIFKADVVPSAEIIGLTAVNEVVVSDCQLLNSDYGVYDGATGERTANSQPVSDGDRQHLIVTLRNIDDNWRVAFVNPGKAAGQCDAAPTEEALVLHG